MRVQVLSDLHIEFEDLEIEKVDSDVVVLAGDIHVKGKGVSWALKNIEDKPVLYVLGNHEFYGKAYPKLIESLKEDTKGTNVTVLEKDTVAINDVNFMGCTLWTDFELFGDPRIAGYHCQQIMNDFKKIRLSPKYSKLRSIDVSAIHRRSLQWLKSELEKHRGEKNVVITHHGPSRISLPDGKEEDMGSSSYVSNLEYVIEEFAPKYWVHGHLHNSSTYQVDNCKVVCNPRGYPDERNKEFTQDFVFQV